MAWLTGWSYRKKLTIDHGQVDGALTDFPVYVHLDADADFHEALATGYDIRFTQSDGETLLKYEREYWTGGAGSAATAHFWVKVPSISAVADTDFYIYAENVWDSYHKGVWHLHEDPASETYEDSTANGNDDAGGGTDPDVVTGRVYNGQEFDRTFSESIVIPEDASLKPGSDDYTLSLWLKSSDTSAYGYALSLYHGGNGDWTGVRQNSSTGKITWFIDDGPTQVSDTGDTGVADGNWHHVAVSFDRDGNGTLYVDGSTDGATKSIASVGAVSPDGPARIGSLSATTYFYEGVLDEVRVSIGIARAAAWLALEHDNIANYASTLNHAAEEAAPAGGAHTRRIGGTLGGRIAVPLQG